MSETIEGTIKSVRNDKKGIQLDNDKWYSNKFSSELDCQVGDNVKVEYKTNGDFNNYEKVTVLKKTESGNQVSSSIRDKTMLLSYAKDIMIASNSIGKNITLNDAVKIVMMGYFEIDGIMLNSEEFITNQLSEKREFPKDVTKEHTDTMDM